MYNVHDFIGWALTHAKGGTEPWHYLYGSVRVQTTQVTLNRYYINHYHEQMTRARYDQLTADWLPTDYATDCPGLLDAWLTYEMGDETDINADMNYELWCTDKGLIYGNDRPFVIGEAVFRWNGKRMTHVGWICGWAEDGCPLVVEARNILYGVVVTRLDSRDFTHRCLMTKKFDYEVPMKTIFEVQSPMLTGQVYAKMQDALNAAGYTDADGNVLEVDGKWGRRSQQAFDALVADYADEVVPKPEPLDTFEGKNGKYRLILEYQ